MSKSVACPNCGKKLRIADDQIGQRGKCPKCNTAFMLTTKPAEPEEEEIAINNPHQSEEPEEEFEPGGNFTGFDDEEWDKEGESFAPASPPRRSKIKSATSPPQYLLLLITGWISTVIGILFTGLTLFVIVRTIMGTVGSQNALAGGMFATSGLFAIVWLLFIALNFGASGQVIFAFRHIAQNSHYLRS